MYRLSPPTDATLRSLLDHARAAPHNYAEVGLSRGNEAPPGYWPNRGQATLPVAFDHASEALLALQMFDLGWLRAVGRVAEGEAVAVTTRVLGVWTAQACRVIYVEREQSRLRWGYGTVAGHAMAGEERFELRREGDRVVYEVFSYSRPATLLSRLALPLVRPLQRRFAVESAARMARC
ncbi:MAG: DUF1990 domain-containing protein [Deltaproteobacteria bacterium]|nr:DUF1990 domain-containing protein [Deltaproteobacteria bacterium]